MKPWKLILFILGVGIVIGLLLASNYYAGPATTLEPKPPAPPKEPFTLPLGVKIIVDILLFAFVVVILSLLGYMLLGMGISVLGRWHGYSYQKDTSKLTMADLKAKHRAAQERSRLDAALIRPDPQGRVGALVRQIARGWQIINLDAETMPTTMQDSGQVDRALVDNLSMAQAAARHQLEIERAQSRALEGMSTYSPKITMDMEGAEKDQPAAPKLQWPEKVQLRDLALSVSVENLTLGVTLDETGQPRPVTAALSRMVHVAIGGSSGWGKSVFLRNLAHQLTQTVDPCQLALIDLEGVTFAPFAQSDRLLWPVADTENTALAIMSNLVALMNERRELYAERPGVDSLGAYNARSYDPLEPIVCLVDEATALLADKDVHSAARTLALRARKYGVWLILGGQDWKAASIDTALRNQIAARVHFKATSPSQSRILLGDGRASELTTPGRAYALLPGQELVEIQTPYVSLDDIRNSLIRQGGPVGDYPEIIDVEIEEDPEVERIRDLHAQGLSLNEIQRDVFGYTGGHAYERVKEILDARAQ